MNAIQFIKDHGVEKAREVVEGASEFDFAYDSVDEEYMRCGDIQDGFSIDDYEDCFLIEDLKRLVESVEYITELGGLEVAKANLCNLYTMVWMPISIEILEQAIADYEAIYEIEN